MSSCTSFILINLFQATSSPVSSIRGINPKESKEKRNLARLLAGSEFSLGPDTDLELDYYDYNVQNASTVSNLFLFLLLFKFAIINTKIKLIFYLWYFFMTDNFIG